MCNNFFSDKTIFSKTLVVTRENYKEYFYKRDFEEVEKLLEHNDRFELNIYELTKYGNNDTEITKEIYIKLNEIWGLLLLVHPPPAQDCF